MYLVSSLNKNKKAQSFLPGIDTKLAQIILKKFEGKKDKWLGKKIENQNGIVLISL